MNYTKTPISLDRLIKEIQNSSITKAIELSQTSVLGDVLTINFKSDLSQEELVILDSIIQNHNGEPLSYEITPNVQTLPFSAKTIEINGTIKKLYKRMHGFQANVSIGSNNLIFTMPYPHAKIIGTTLIGGEILDKASLYVIDSNTGSYSGIPNYTLNQFGFDVNIAKDQHKYESKYDADIFYGMQIKIVYTSISNKTIGINIDLDEIK